VSALGAGTDDVLAWRPTAAVLRVSVLPAALAALAVLLRRADLLVLVAPLALAAVPLVRRPAGRPRGALEVPQGWVPEGEPVPATVGVVDAEGAQTAALELATPDWVRPDPGTVAAGVLRPAGVQLSVPLRLTARRWGWSAVGPGTLVLSACGGLLRAGPAPVAPGRVRVVPLSARYAGAELLPRARGAVGLHRSQRLGEGTELAGIRPFAPGDRIRRVNWRTSLRTGELQVNATTTERDAAVLLLLDARFDAGTSGGVDGHASGVDVAVRATAALTAFYLGLGDRVGLVAAAATTRVLPARTGRGQLERVLSALLGTSAPGSGGAEPRLAVPPDLDPRALVLVVSPLVGRAVFERCAALAQAGHAVVVVDTLPPDALPDDGDPWAGPVGRLWLLERATRIGQLQLLGVPVVPWQGSGSLDAVLVELTRAAARSGGRR
jgi:uncharacterized protein (DUF58 family)